ncbi:DNA-binding transcriptional regulator YbjK [Leifsonia sp. 98AMF]|uniref:TetR/AcrR family transcriptional regulator n=1 Tax=unclassified Leifsonia TaxID=2663824 RepID=UPI00087D1B59|nr:MULTISPECIES: TetR/AcrR family transcriptional regulator [unclassified Leifsonia]SDH28856.1 DNA-binding transcriptional regulator YbjK [Leifsonia sp. 197AMF]SDJ09146.1 DNA-binding transcriptional regulator YbjK [Leifsonia sp. 466MF]SDJ61628.1 DNA-binding transcriptional regulator YbjK [Leifsonia sp. 157MF]SDN30315.1 DNA-binding transcriptional regulator YbjK [Leifsonia sp. 509MF]SEM90864.1 DNA-binding transcriptional regulator YbjK [Leifsonia sp. 467MF]
MPPAAAPSSPAPRESAAPAAATAAAAAAITPSGARVSARDRVLDAFEELLAEQSERAATLDAVAARAGVSKGGLLYHFASKEALAAGVLDRFAALIDEDVAAMRAAPDGPVDYFLRTSIPTDSRFERAIVAIARLAQAADPQARDALARAQRRWLEVLQEAVGDPLVARTIMLIGDGMYYNTALLPAANNVLRDETDIDDLVALIRRFAGDV